MKNKIILEVYLPAAGTSFDISIPRQIKVAQAISMLVEFLRKQDKEYIPTDESVLCDMESGKAFDANAFIDQVGLHTGSRVMVI